MGRSFHIDITSLKRYVAHPIATWIAFGFSGLSGFAIMMMLPLQEDTAASYPTPVDFNGALLRWDIDAASAPITYEVKASDDYDATVLGVAIDDAAAMWTDVPTSYFAFAKVEEGATAQVTINLQSTLDGAPFSSGYAVFDEYTDEGRPLHCSIFIAITDTAYQSIAKTALHELGHCVGLGHSLIPEAIMSYRLSENSFALDLDDEAAVTRLYPADGSNPSLPPGCAIGAAQRQKSWPSLILLLLGPLCCLVVCQRKSQAYDR